MKLKRTFALFLAVCLGLLAGISPNAAAAGPFADVSAEYADILSVLSDAGIVQGTGGGRFEGGEPLTRAQFAVFIASTLGLSDTSGVTFADVPDGAWYSAQADAAATAGYVAPDGDFKPDSAVTRLELFEFVETYVKGDNTFRPDPKCISPLIRSMDEPVTRYQAAAVFGELYGHKTAPKPMHNKMVVGYYGDWQAYSRLLPADIPWNMLTHLNHAFLTVSDGTPSDDSFDWAATELYQLAFTDSWADIWMDAGAGDGGIFRVYELMGRIYPNVSVMMSVGGWSRSQMFSAMASTAENRAVFIDSTIAFLDRMPWIGGIDLDWEYPGVARDPVEDTFDDPVDFGSGLNSDVTKDKENFTLLLKELRAAMDEAGYADKLLTLAVSANYEKSAATQDLDAIAGIVDFVNLMTYDYTGPGGDENTQHHAAVYANDYGDYSVESCVKGYLKNFKPEQLNVGVATYSTGWAGVEPDEDGNLLGRPSGTDTPAADTGHPDASPDSRYFRGTGNAGWGQYEVTEGWSDGKHKATDFPELIGQWYGLFPGASYSYPELMKMKADTSRYQYYYDETAQAPYMYDLENKLFLSFEDERSAKAKGDFVLENGLGGLMFWETATDDVANGFPLTRVMYETMCK